MSFYELDRPAAPGLLDRVIGSQDTSI